MKEHTPAYLNPATFGRLSSYLRASLDDFVKATARKCVRPDMRVFVCEVDDGAVCEVCLAGGTFATRGSPRQISRRRYELETAGIQRMYSVDCMREGRIGDALRYFYAAKGVPLETIDKVINERRAQLESVTRLIGDDYDKQDFRAPLRTYYEAADALERIGL